MRATSALVAVVFFAAIIVIIITGYNINIRFFGGEGSVHKTNLQSDLYVMSHALDAARLYLDTSLDYSVYQACYENLKRGGLNFIDLEDGEGGIAYLPDLDSEEFFSELTETVDEYFNLYSAKSYSFIGDDNVVLPRFDIFIEEQGSGLEVEAYPYSKLQITRRSDSGETATLRASWDRIKSYDIPCYTLFQKARELNTDVESDLEDALEEATQEVYDSKCESNEECTELLNDEINGDSRVSSDRTIDGYSVSSQLSAATASITQRIEDKQTGEIIFSISVSITQEISITEAEPPDDHFYPVWNGQELSFEPFSIIYINKVTKNLGP